MLKNTAALALAAALGATAAIGTQEILLGTAGATVYRAHQIDIRQSRTPDEAQPSGFAYTTALTPNGDGGLRLTDLSGHPCPLDTKAVQDCAKVLLEHGATEACR